MTGLNLVAIETEITERVRTELNGWEVFEGGVDDAITIAETNGVEDPYVVLRYSDFTATERGGSFLGTRYDEYYSQVDALCVASSDKEARQLASWVSNALLGFKPANCGEIGKNFGGGSFSQAAVNSVPQYYIAVRAFNYHFNMIVDGAGYEGN